MRFAWIDTREGHPKPTTTLANRNEAPP